MIVDMWERGRGALQPKLTVAAGRTRVQHIRRRNIYRTGRNIYRTYIGTGCTVA